MAILPRVAPALPLVLALTAPAPHTEPDVTRDPLVEIVGEPEYGRCNSANVGCGNEKVAISPGSVALYQRGGCKRTKKLANVPSEKEKRPAGVVWFNRGDWWEDDESECVDGAVRKYCPDGDCQEPDDFDRHDGFDNYLGKDDAAQQNRYPIVSLSHDAGRGLHCMMNSGWTLRARIGVGLAITSATREQETLWAEELPGAFSEPVLENVAYCVDARNKALEQLDAAADLLDQLEHRRREVKNPEKDMADARAGVFAAYALARLRPELWWLRPQTDAARARAAVVQHKVERKPPNEIEELTRAEYELAQTLDQIDNDELRRRETTEPHYVRSLFVHRPSGSAACTMWKQETGRKGDIDPFSFPAQPQPLCRLPQNAIPPRLEEARAALESVRAHRKRQHRRIKALTGVGASLVVVAAGAAGTFALGRNLARQRMIDFVEVAAVQREDVAREGQLGNRLMQVFGPVAIGSLIAGATMLGVGIARWVGYCDVVRSTYGTCRKK